MQRIHIVKNEFERILALGSQCIAPSRSLPLSEFVRISIKGSKIKVEAFNEMSSIRAYGELSIDSEPCAFCVSCKDLANFVKAVSDDEVTLVLEESSVKLLHSRGECSFPIAPAEDFPDATKIDEDKKLQSFQMKGDTLVRWIGYAKDFVSQDELRPNISGIYVYCENGKIGFCATDQTTLVTDEYVTDEYRDLNTSFIVNNKAFSSIVNIFKDVDYVDVSVASSNVILSTEGIRLFLRKTTSTFPNFKVLFNSFSSDFVTFRRRDLYESLKRLNLCCNAKLKRVVLSFDNGRLNLHHDNLIDNKSASEDIPYDGECCLKIAFVLDNLMRTLVNAGTDEMKICLVAANKPVLIAESGDEASLSKKFLVCPSMRV